MPFEYKKLVKNRKTRKQILRFFDWVPDRVVVPLQYRLKTGRWPNLKNPQRFTEKLQWLKLNCRDPLMRQCADKVEVRSYVESCGLEEILVPLLGVYDSPREIDFDALPERFVLKDSLGGGGNDVIVCTDRRVFSKTDACDQMSRWVLPGAHGRHPGREWVYDTSRSSRILCESYIEADDGLSLTEYKFFCSYGAPSFLYVLADRVLGKGVSLGIYEAEDFRKVEAYRVDEHRLERNVQMPPNYKRMLEIAKILSAPFPSVRVDLYDLGKRGGVRFGELTFFDGSGYFSYDPDSFDFELGATIKLDKGGS